MPGKLMFDVPSVSLGMPGVASLGDSNAFLGESNSTLVFFSSCWQRKKLYLQNMLRNEIVLKQKPGKRRQRHCPWPELLRKP